MLSPFDLRTLSLVNRCSLIGLITCDGESSFDLLNRFLLHETRENMKIYPPVCMVESKTVVSMLEIDIFFGRLFS